MSALGQNRTIPVLYRMFGIPPITIAKADFPGAIVGPDGQSIPALPRRSNLDLLCNRDGIVYLYAKVPHGTLDLGMTEQQLDSAQIACPPVNQRRFRATQ
jgi:hypothetical protein